MLKQGDIFTHRHWLDPDHSNAPLRCKVTKIARGMVYYRPYYGLHDDGTEWLGALWKFELMNAARYVQDTRERHYQDAVTGADQRATEKLIAGLKRSQ